MPASGTDIVPISACLTPLLSGPIIYARLTISCARYKFCPHGMAQENALPA